VAYLSYRYYESYFLALKSKFQTASQSAEIEKGKLSSALWDYRETYDAHCRSCNKTPMAETYTTTAIKQI